MGVFKKIIAGILAAVVAFPVGFVPMFLLMQALEDLLGYSQMRRYGLVASPFLMIGVALFLTVAVLVWRFMYSRLLRAMGWRE